MFKTKMNNNLSNLNISTGLFNKCAFKKQYETTYESSYGNFYPNECNIKENLRYGNNKTFNLKSNHLLLNQSNKNMPNSQLICPNCINESIVLMKSLSRSRINRKKSTNGCFEDKMKILHKKKLEKDIKDREDRAKKTYTSLFDNRERSANYKKIYLTNNNSKNLEKSTECEYFGKDIDYGMIRCRNRELKNDKKIFGLNLNKNLKNNKSWICKNYLLDKDEYSRIIDEQIEKHNQKNFNERYFKLKEEKKILDEQLQKEKMKIEDEKDKRKKLRYEMNRANSVLLKTKNFRENNEKRMKRKEEECISNICKKEIEDFIKNLKMKKIRNKNIEEENYKTSQIKNKMNENRKKNDKIIYPGLKLEEIVNKKCQQCNRKYPKNVMSQIYYTYNEQQKK